MDKPSRFSPCDRASTPPVYDEQHQQRCRNNEHDDPCDVLAHTLVSASTVIANDAAMRSVLRSVTCRHWLWRSAAEARRPSVTRLAHARNCAGRLWNLRRISPIVAVQRSRCMPFIGRFLPRLGPPFEVVFFLPRRER